MARETAPTDPLPPDSVVLGAFAGVRNTRTAERLLPAELQIGRNIDIDDTKQVRRRRGYTKKANGNFHSVCTIGDRTYVVKDGVLSRVYPNYTFTSLKSGIGPSPLSYVAVGDDIYFSSSTNSGIISATDAVSDWGAVAADGTWLSPVVNPTSTLSPIGGKLLGPPPLATSLAYLNGRIYLAHDNVLWATELYLYTLVDKTRTFIQYESPITFLAAVVDGVYVGTQSGVYFASGPFGQMARTKVSDSGGLPGSAVIVPVELASPSSEGLGPKAATGVMFTTSSGVYLGYPGGTCYNLTSDNVDFPKATTAASFFRQQDGFSQYISVMDTGGTPQSSARIGDYIDAEIRRAI